MNLYKKALEFATKKHSGQKRKNGDNYIIHPIRVSQEVFTETQKACALLHDTIEDTSATYEEIEQTFGKQIADIVYALTHHKDEPYDRYIQRIKQFPDAIQVKIADITDNLNDSPTSKAITKSANAITELLK